MRRIPALLIVISHLTVPLLRAQAPGKATSARSQAAQTGVMENGIYRNSRFGFQFNVPFGWVDRSEQMRDDSSDHVGTAAPGSLPRAKSRGPAERNSASNRPTSQGSNSLLLLAVFERPPEAQGSSVNSAVVITAESTSAYAGLKAAADYFVPLSDVATGKGFTVTNEPYYFNIGAKKVVRGDFGKKVGDVTMYQSSIVLLDKGYFVSFTFLGGGEDEVNELIEKLSFSGVAGKRSHTSK